MTRVRFALLGVTLFYQQMAAYYKNGVNSNFIHRQEKVTEPFWNFRFSALIFHKMLSDLCLK